MYRSFLISIFVFGLARADTCKVPSGRLCDPDVYDCCDTNFRTYLNLTECTGDQFTRVSCYRDEIERLFGQSVDSGLSVCAAWSDWMKCLGVTLMDCESIKFHISQGSTSGQAMNIFAAYSQFAFICGAGLDTYVNNDQCIRQVFTGYRDQLKRCRDTFSNNLQNNWNNRCTDFRELIGCYQFPFTKDCGTEVGWFGCEYERSGITPWLPECPEQCNTN